MKFKRKVYEIHSDKLNNGQSLSLILMSDLHLAEYGKDNSVLINEIRQINPDAILLAGDMVTAKDKYNTIVAEKLLCTLAKEYPVYYGIGNHEERIKLQSQTYGKMFSDYCNKLRKAGVILLFNKKALIHLRDIKVCIWGLELPLSYYQRFTDLQLEKEEIVKRLGYPDDNVYNILLAHHPRYADTYFDWGADLTLSGHVHGGVMRLGNKACISPDFCIFPKYGYGKFDRDGKTLVISGGLGQHTIPFRIFNPKELVHLIIK